MSEVFSCDDKETLVAYLYGEIDADTRREVERHMRSCAACTQEIEGLRAVRSDLETWLPPDAELGFTIVQKPAANVLRPARWASLGAVPAWAKAAAAVLILGIGVAVANVQVRYDTAGLTVTTGWMGAPAPAAPALRTPGAPVEDWRPALVALERDLRSDLATMRRVDAAEPVALRTTQSNNVDTAAVLRRVQAMLDESEQRQRQELALRLTQQRREIEMTRQADWVRIGRSFDSLQGRTFKTEAGQQEMMNLFRRVSAQPIP